MSMAHEWFRHQLVVPMYFSARFSETPADPTKHKRQLTYLSAQLAVSPTFRVFYGE